ncbi:MAG: hypothetical protein EDM05_020655 [Leptolyngbya sp. IPPAS B-1204]
MNFQQGLEIVNQVMLADMGRQLTEVEIALLTGAWHDHTYEQIAAASGYSLNYLQRDAGPKFWKLLSQVFDRKLNKTTVWAVLERFEFTLQQAQSSTVSSAQLDPTPSSASAPAPPLYRRPLHLNRCNPTLQKRAIPLNARKSLLYSRLLLNRLPA